MIIHGPRPDRNFTIIPNDVLRDENLTYRARGILCYLLSQPCDWTVSSHRLRREATEGRDAIRAALKELMNAGYLRRDREQDARGLWQTHYTVVAEPWRFDWLSNFPQAFVDNSATDA